MQNRLHNTMRAKHSFNQFNCNTPNTSLSGLLQLAVIYVIYVLNNVDLIVQLGHIM